VGKSLGKPVGISVSVPVGVYRSAPIDVTVGVNVNGVAVDVANRFCVGMGVSLINGVGVSVGGGDVGVASRAGTLGKPEQLPRRIARKRNERHFFMKGPLVVQVVLRD
jgi:hypothetical protein